MKLSRHVVLALWILVSLVRISAVRAQSDIPRTWGLNNYGQLGRGSTTDSNFPLPVNYLTGVVAVATGNYHSVVARNDGTVWAWGRNNYGQLGNGSTTASSVPIQVSNLNGVTSVATKNNHCLALKNDGTVWAWGYNGQGQLGNGSTTNSSLPVQVGNLTGVMAVATGDYHSLALKNDGTVWAWGSNSNKQLSFSSNPFAYADSSVPVQVFNLTGVVAIAAAGSHSLAVKNDGTVWAWGWNNQGQLGNGSTTDSAPVQVSNLTGVVAIGAGYMHSLAIKNDGTVWAWGYNYAGQLGNGSIENSSSVPIQVSNLSGITAVAAGEEYSLALRSDGTVWGWGDNSSGQLGNGSWVDSSVPIQVSNLTGATAIAAGYRHSLAKGRFFEIVLSDVTAQESTTGTTTATFTVSLTSGNNRTVQVNFATADGSAVAGSDYQSTSGILTFAPGETSKSISVPIIGDAVFEGDETFTINLSGASGAVIADTQGVGTIRNAPPITLNLAVTPSTFSEAAGAGVTGTVALDAASNTNITVTLTSSNTGAATVPSNTTITAGSLSATFPVSAANDALLDGDQTTTITATATGFSSKSVLATVADDEIPSLNLTINPATFAETAGASAALGTITITPATSATIVNLSSSDTALIGVPASLTIPAGGSSGNFSLSVSDDVLVNGTRNVTVSASLGNLSSPKVVQVTDNDVLPSISSFTPGNGPASTSVVITGSNFNGTTSVTFNTATATFSINSPTQITATVPTNATSGVIRVTTPSGVATSTNTFLVSPTVSGFSPESGTAGTSVIINGANFNGTSEVRFGSKSASFTVVSPTQISTAVPPGALTGPISIANAGGSTTSLQNFRVTPVPTTCTPSHGTAGTRVVIAGSALTGTSVVKFGGINAPDFSVDSDSQISALVPEGAQSGAIEVTTPGGTTSSVQSFTLDIPKILSFSPTGGAEGTTVFITGEALTGATQVRFNGTTTTATVNSSQRITATVPTGATTGRLEVLTPVGVAQSTQPFQVAAGAFTFAPTQGLRGSVVTLTGTNFSGTNSVQFGGREASFTVNSTTQITATVPDTALTGVVRVTNGGGSVTSAQNFLVMPSASTCTPSHGTAGTRVVIAGSALTGTSVVKFGGTNAPDFTVDSDTQLSATVPDGALSGQIEVTTPGGITLSTAAFTVDTPVLTLSSGTSVSISEGQSQSITITRNTPTLGPLTVALRSSDPQRLDVEPVVLIPAGQESATFTLTALDDAIAPDPGVTDDPITLTASVDTIAPTRVQVSITDNDTPHLSLQIAPTTVREGGTALATVKRNTRAATTLKVTLRTTPTVSGLELAGSVTLDAGAQATTFVVNAPDDTIASARRIVILNATAPGFTNSPQTSLTIDDNDLPALQVLVVPGTVFETDGPKCAQGEVIRNTPTNVALTVTLLNSQPSKARFPASVIIPVGQNSARFDIDAINDDAPSNTNVVQIGARATIAGVGTVTARAANLAVLDDDKLRLSVGFTAERISESAHPNSVQGRVTRTGADRRLPLVVRLTSSVPTRLRVPATVTIPAGVSAATFALTPVNNGLNDGQIVALINALGNGAQTSGPIVVTDDDTPASTPRFTLRGRIVTVTRAGVSGLGVVLKQGAQAIDRVRTGADGSFVFNGVRAGSYSIVPDSSTLTPLPLTGVVGPANRAVIVGSANLSDQNFTFAPRTYTVSGRIVGSDGRGIGGVRLLLNLRSGLSDANGNYRFTQVPNGNYLLTPARSGFAFISPNRRFAINSADNTQAGFVARNTQAPQIANFAPARGGAGTEVLLNGSNLAGARVLLGRSSCVVLLASATQVRLRIPAGAQDGVFTLTTAAGTVVSSHGFDVVSNLPRINSFTPSVGNTGTSVTINGSGFGVGTTVRFNGVLASVVRLSDNKLSATVPANMPVGSGPLTVSVPDSGTGGALQTVVAPHNFFVPYCIAVHGNLICNDGTGPNFIPGELDPAQHPVVGAPQVPTSPVRLSSSQVSTSYSRIVLQWSGALDAPTASDVTHWSVVCKGEELAIESVSVQGNRIVLGFAADGWTASARLGLTWRGLRDVPGRLIATAGTTLLAP